MVCGAVWGDDAVDSLQAAGHWPPPKPGESVRHGAHPRGRHPPEGNSMRKPLTWLVGMSVLGGSLAVAVPPVGAAGHTSTATHAHAVGVANDADQLLAAAPIETVAIWRLQLQATTGDSAIAGSVWRPGIPCRLLRSAAVRRCRLEPLGGPARGSAGQPAAVRGCRLEPLGGPARGSAGQLPPAAVGGCRPRLHVFR